MQRPTCTMLRVRTPSDAHVIFHAVSLNLLPIVARRLDTEERRAISSGCVFVWEERGSNAESTGLGIERWTDSIRWGPSRVKDEFLFYHEKEPDTTDLELASESNAPVTPHHYSRGFYRENLIKQTYSVFVETPRGRRKWHLIAYFTQESLEFLHTIDDIPGLASLHVPPGKYKSARSAKNNNKSSAILTAPTYYNPAILDTNRRLPTLSASERRNPSLAPLAYLENIPPPRRHPVDEEALMSFSGLPV
ncbi:Gti1/Pac2 family-domain-containing protein [Lentinula raphanica]|nr:Gti1/Pac2 family-domain-containing protein [Lentinula raphanica]